MSKSISSREGQTRAITARPSTGKERTKTDVHPGDDWSHSRQDLLIRERAYRSYLSDLRAELREEAAKGAADLKLLRRLSAKNGVSLSWYLFKIALPVLEDEFHELP